MAKGCPALTSHTLEPLSIPGHLPVVNSRPVRALRFPFLFLALFAATASAQVRLPARLGGGQAPSDSQPRVDSTPHIVEPGSPRQSLEQYFALSREGRWQEAARYLSVEDADSARAVQLAERLKAVLNRHLWIDLD